MVFNALPLLKTLSHTSRLELSLAIDEPHWFEGFQMFIENSLIFKHN